MKSINSPLTTLLVALMAIPLLVACGSQQEDSISVLHHFNKGNEAYGIEDYRRAIIHFARALELDETSPDIQYNLGLAYYRSGNHEQAVTAFTAALKARPTMIDAHFNLALAHDRLFNADAAHTHYNIYRNLVSTRTEARTGATRGAAGGSAGGASAASISARGSATGRVAGGAGGRAGGTMVNGAPTPGNLAGPRIGGGTPGALTGGGSSAGRGRPIPRIKPTGNYAGVPGAGSQGLGQGATSGESAVRRPASQARRSGAPPAYQPAPAPAQNTHNPSGDQEKWWIQDRFNRTR